MKQQYLGFLNTSSISNSQVFFGLTPFNFEEISKKSTLPNSIDLTINHNEVLGKRAEHFFEYSIRLSPHYEVIAKNIQIFKEKITIGELDFLVKDIHNHKVIHIELVFKFYVYDPNILDEINRWIGPNRKDSLVEKIDKLKNKQLPLLFNDQTKSILDDFNLDVNKIDQQVCYLASLFVPYSFKEKEMQLVNNDSIVGYWIHFEEFIPKKYASFRFYIPKKKDWIVHPRHHEVWHSFDEIYEQIEDLYMQKKSSLLWINNGENSYERIFIIWW
ncbi:DUF1853 family protein [Aquimarina sp. 2304DJ70-9]|uniref:DUF1853 family protein n=1 Tax=Aquimarina penaris TaxID=3231044 RepID=UPI003462C09A